MAARVGRDLARFSNDPISPSRRNFARLLAPPEPARHLCRLIGLQSPVGGEQQTQERRIEDGSIQGGDASVLASGRAHWDSPSKNLVDIERPEGDKEMQRIASGMKTDRRGERP
jgi:hypothetical protein